MFHYTLSSEASFKKAIGNRNHIGGRFVRLLQISDLHARRLDGESNRTVHPEEAAEYYLKEFLQLVSGLPDSCLHGLVISGDLVLASALASSSGSEEAIDSRHGKLMAAHEFSVSCVRKFLSALKLGTDAGSCLVVPGNHDILRNASPPQQLSGVTQITSYHDTVYTSFAQEVKSMNTFVRGPKLCLYEAEGGLVAIFGVDSNHSVYIDRSASSHGLVTADQLNLLEKAIGVVRKQYANKPVYVVVTLHHHLLPVEDFDLAQQKADHSSGDTAKSPCPAQAVMVSVTLDAATVIKRLQAMRVSLVLHGHMHQGIIQNVSYYWDGDLHRLVIMGCHSFPQPAVFEDSRDGVSGGSVLTFDTVRGTVQIDVINIKDRNENKSIMFPLTSVTRISSGEYRIWHRLQCWLSSGNTQAVCYPFQFKPDNGTLSELEPEFRQAWESHGYVRCWGTDNTKLGVKGDVLDLPTKRYRLLLILQEMGEPREAHILLNNHIATRDSLYGSWDAALLPAFRNIADFFDRVRMDLLRVRDDLMVDTTKDASRRSRILREVEKQLGRLAGNADADLEKDIVELGTAEFIKFSPTDGVPQRYIYTLCLFPPLSLVNTHEKTWAPTLTELPMVSANELYRFEPGHNKKAKPGYIWYPLSQWRETPAIRERNGDVMAWVERMVDCLKRYNHGHFPAYITLGACHKDELHSYDLAVSETHTFEKLQTKLLSTVLYYNNSIRPYEGATIRQVHLVRQAGSAVITVIDPGNNEPLGKLCPSQRYVLRQGLEKARALRKKLLTGDAPVDLAHLGTDQAGYLTVKRGSVTFDVLPPILEPVWNPGDDLQEREFLICDGNHRIVEYCWREGCEGPLNAVLIDKPNVPYYIRPMRPADWPAVADNPLPTTPDLAAKYTVRQPTDEEIAKYISDPSKRPGKASAYRVYFRDFSQCFAIGPQGGVLCQSNEVHRNPD